MSELHIRTDNRWKNFVYGADVPDKIKKENYGHLDEESLHDGFLRYLGRWYHMSDFSLIPKGFIADAGWDGYHPDSFSSGVVLKVAPDGESYRVGTYIA
jgi:hypothetical protein